MVVISNIYQWNLSRELGWLPNGIMHLIGSLSHGLSIVNLGPGCDSCTAEALRIREVFVHDLLCKLVVVNLDFERLVRGNVDVQHH